ncbi:MAG: hypothetical protein DMG72_24640 [Acidobacteria bacterium]|nr:MAG: hypothetical protein DMG72_24640 [Acidobacteriota bacterium]
MYEYVLSVKNWGRTSGHVISVYSEPKIVNRLDDLPREPEYSAGGLKDVRFLAPQESWEFDSYNPSEILSKEQWDEIHGGKKKLIYYGVTTYRDIFKEDTHYSRFCYTYSSSLGFFILLGPPGYNKYT